MTYRLEPRTAPTYETCIHCRCSEEDHGDVCRECRNPIEAHMVHAFDHKYDPVQFVSCVELPWGSEFERVERPR